MNTIRSLTAFARHQQWSCFLIAGLLWGSLTTQAQTKPAAPAPAPDVLVLSNGDTLHGKFVSEVAGKVTFNTEPLGDVALTWDKIKQLHIAENFAVLDKNVKLRGKKTSSQIPIGKIDVADQAVTVRLETQQTIAPIPVANTQYIVDEATLHKQVDHEPKLWSGWNGAITAGGTVVTATQDQFTLSGGASMVRVVPTVNWLDPRNRMTADFSGSYGKITQPGYTAAGVYTPGSTTKSAIYHADAERDQYFSPRFYTLAQLAFDHNFSQDLNLQQIYGAGIGWTVLKAAKQTADLKATVQYEKQQFISGATGTNQNLIGSTFAATYVLHEKLVTYTQGLAYIPAYNQPQAYSANESNTFAFPAYKSLSFSLGTIDSYLNDPPTSLPPTKRNSFQFTMGLTYAIKSKY
jgi:hypothetical protein